MARGLARAGFDLDLRHGLTEEGVLARILADGGHRVEVKSDGRAKETGKFFIELRQKGRPSGLLTTEAEWWAFRYDENTWVITSTAALKALVKRAAARELVAQGGDFDNYDGVLVPVAWFIA